MDFQLFNVPLYEIIIFMIFGLGQEVVVTGILFGRKDKLLKGYSSIWYMPIYALVPFILDLLLPIVGDINFIFRGLIYAAIFLMVEFAWMELIKLTLGKTPSEKEYLKSKWGIHGLTRLDHTPYYFVSGLLLEWLYLSIR